MNNESPTFSIDPAEFAGRRVFVTGGSMGAGEAIVRRLAAGGATNRVGRRVGPSQLLDLSIQGSGRGQV